MKKVRSMVRRLVVAVQDLLFPPKCSICGQLVGKNGMLCFSCQSQLPRAGEGVRLNAGTASLCCATPFFYEGGLREAFHRYKFAGGLDCVPLFGSFLTQAVVEQLDEEWDLVTWAPLSRRRLRKRGYDQAKLLAAEVAQALGVPLVSTLEKKKHTKEQSSLDAQARAENVKSVYGLAKHCPNLQGKQILLVDDIVTTGSTMGACAQVLLSAGAKGVDCAALARGQRSRQGAEKKVSPHR